MKTQPTVRIVLPRRLSQERVDLQAVGKIEENTYGTTWPQAWTQALPEVISGGFDPQGVREPSGSLMSACLTWTKAINSSGYGVIKRNGRQMYAHRYFYEVMRGPIPVGMQLDHLCRNKRCVNPEHLEPVSARINMLRASRWRTHCKNGHSYAENTYWTPKGARACRVCRREATRRRDSCR